MSHHLLTTQYWQVSATLTSLGIATASFMLLFFLIALPSNILIILSILCQRLHRQPTHLLLLSLALSDLIMCLLALPLNFISGIAGEFIFGDSDNVRCKVCQSAGVCFLASILSSLHILAFLSLDRFLFIRFPLRYDSIVTCNKTLLAILSVCVLSVLLAIPPLFGFGDINFDHLTFGCSPRLDHHTHVTKNIYYIMMVVGEGLLPFLILVLTNTWVACLAQRQIRKIYKIRKSIGSTSEQKAYQQSLKDRMQQEKYRKQLQLLRVFGAIFIAHIITWIPIIVRAVEALIHDSDDFSQGSNFIIIVSITAHPVLHPMIEACLLPEIRKYFFRVFCMPCNYKHCRDSEHMGSHTESSTACDVLGSTHKSNCGCLVILNSATVLPQSEINA